MKRNFYLLCTIILGTLLSFIVHGLVEFSVILLLVSDFETYGLGLTWGTWWHIHTVFTAVLFLCGVVGGYKLGVTWWRIVYIEHRHWRAR